MGRTGDKGESSIRRKLARSRIGTNYHLPFGLPRRRQPEHQGKEQHYFDWQAAIGFAATCPKWPLLIKQESSRLLLRDRLPFAIIKPASLARPVAIAPQGLGVYYKIRR